jgi:two-component system, cell cycle sensor histidine kinase and response regulator CckA
MGQKGGADERADPRDRDGRNPAVLGGAVVIAVAIGLTAAFALSGVHVPRWALYGGAVLALLGLFAVLGTVFGLLRFGSQTAQREFYDGLCDAIDEPLVATDGRGRAIYGNAPFLHFATAAGADRLVGMDVLFSGHAEFAEAVYQLAQAGHEGRREEREIRLAAGSQAPGGKPDRPVWLRLKVAPIGGRQRATVWILQDISADRARQEQAFARLQFIITYLDKAPAGFFSTLSDGRVDYINATLAGWLGIDVAQSQGGGLELSTIVGDAGARLLSGVRPQPGGIATESFDLDLRLATGKLMPVQVVHRVDFDAQGKGLPSRTLVVARRSSSGVGADESNLRLARLVAAVPIGIAEVGGDGVLRQANAAFLSLSPHMQRGNPLSAAVAESERRALAQGLVAAMAREAEPVAVDATLAGTTTRTVQFVFVKLAATDEAVAVFAVDKTERQALEVQLAQSQKMQAVGQLASGIAHDFNNVLTPIIGFADLLLAKMRPTDPSFADVMNIKQNANRAANLVRQLLAFSRKQTLQPKVHSLSEAMSDLGNLLGRVLGEKVGLKIAHGRDLGLVLVDIHQFEQVIINLAVNARDAMPNGGTLTVRTYNVSEEESRAIKVDLMPPAEYVAVEVEDTGTGIPRDILNKIWEPFFSTKEVGKGTGLGLSTVYGIIKQTGGFVFVDSVIGKGTTFRIYLPRHYPKPVAAEATAAAGGGVPQAPRADHTGKGRILLVEDEDAVRAFAVRALTSRGYTVIEADSGESALAVIEQDDKGFELILSDVVMPEMDGPTLLRELRKRGIKTKVIFVSGYAEDAFEKNLEGQTDFVFLPKPFSLKQLVEKVKEVMEG